MIQNLSSLWLKLRIFIFKDPILHVQLMIFIIYFSFSIENYFLKKKFKFELKKLFYKLIFSFLIMFVIGYFESNLINAISTGYGQFKIDLFGFFDPNIEVVYSWVQTPLILLIKPK